LNIHLKLPLISPSGFPTKTLHAPLLFPYVPHAQPISYSLIRSPE
jgi:hypothetical protein